MKTACWGYKHHRLLHVARYLTASGKKGEHLWPIFSLASMYLKNSLSSTKTTRRCDQMKPEVLRLCNWHDSFGHHCSNLSTLTVTSQRTIPHPPSLGMNYDEPLPSPSQFFGFWMEIQMLILKLHVTFFWGTHRLNVSNCEGLEHSTFEALLAASVAAYNRRPAARVAAEFLFFQQEIRMADFQNGFDGSTDV